MSLKFFIIGGLGCSHLGIMSEINGVSWTLIPKNKLSQSYWTFSILSLLNWSKDTVENWSIIQLHKGPFTLSIFTVQLMSVTGKFRLPIRQLSKLINRRSEFFSHVRESLSREPMSLRRLTIIEISRNILPVFSSF